MLLHSGLRGPIEGVTACKRREKVSPSADRKARSNRETEGARPTDHARVFPRGCLRTFGVKGGRVNNRNLLDIKSASSAASQKYPWNTE